MARKKIFEMKMSKTTVMILLIVLLLVITGLALHFHLVPTGTQSAIGVDIVGACTQPNIITNDSLLGAKAFQCTLVPGSKFIQTTLSPSDAQRLFGVTTNQSAIISLQVLKDNCRYGFNNVSYPVYQYTIQPNDIRWESSGGVGWGCRSRIANPSYSSATVEARYGTYIGTTPVVCPSYGCNNINDPNAISGCTNVWRKQIGVVYNIAPQASYDFVEQINMTLGNVTYSAIITQNNISVLTPAFRANLLGQLQGQTACPADPGTSAYVSATPSTTPLIFVNSLNANDVINRARGIVSLNDAIANGASYNTQVTNMIASRPNNNQYASFVTNASTSVNTAYVLIEPQGTVSIPAINMYFNADKLGLVVPSGRPSIVNTNVARVNSATSSLINVTVLNSGDSDNMVASLQCSGDPSPFSTTDNIPSGQTKILQINYGGAGFIKDCLVKVNSVNSPQNQANQTIKLIVNPFCAISAPNPAAQPVFTELGCAYICNNYGGSTDVFDSSCGVITTYDRCISHEVINGTEHCTARNSYSGLHCLANGRYIEMNQYLDGVNRGSIEAFIPTPTAHQYYVTKYNNQPVCRYVNEYGYNNGVAIASLNNFDYARGYPEASQFIVSANDTSVTNTPIVIQNVTIINQTIAEVPATPPTPVPIVQPDPNTPTTPTQQFDISQVIIASVVIIVIGVSVIIGTRRLRK